MRRRARIAVLFTSTAALLYAFATACGSGTRPGAAGDGHVYGPGYAGPCQLEGETAACHVQTGRSGNIVNCFSGVQTCHDGVWSACGGSVGTASIAPLTVTAIGPSPDAGGCANNPCDPWCLGIDVDAGALAPDGGIIQGIAVQGSIIDYASFPTAKQAALSVAGGWCPMGVPATGYKECSYDYCCGSPDGGGASGTCQRWLDVPEAGACQKAAGTIDFTVGIGCVDGSGVTHIPICNRGAVDATSGSVVVIDWTANPNTTGTSSICQLPTSGTYKGQCTVDLATLPMKAGKCIEINLTTPANGITCDPGLFGSGNHTAMINPPSGTYGSAYTQRSEGDVCNNQSFVYTQQGACAAYGAQPPPPANYSYPYSGSCPPGTIVQWNQFAYAATVPTTSSVTFTATTSSADGGVSGPFPIATSGTAGSTDPAICAFSGPAPCPKDLTSILGSHAQDPTLTIGVNLTSVTAVPTVQSWQVSYSCVPEE